MYRPSLISFRFSSFFLSCLPAFFLQINHVITFRRVPRRKHSRLYTSLAPLPVPQTIMELSSMSAHDMYRIRLCVCEEWRGDVLKIGDGVLASLSLSGHDGIRSRGWIVEGAQSVRSAGLMSLVRRDSAPVEKSQTALRTAALRSGQQHQAQCSPAAEATGPRQRFRPVVGVGVRPAHRQDRLAPREVLRGLGLFHGDALVDRLVCQFRIERQPSRKPDGPELKSAELRRSERAYPTGIGLNDVRHVHGTSQQRDLLLGRRREHAKLPLTVIAHLAVLLRVARCVPARGDAARRDRLSRLLAAACPAHATHRRHLIARRVHVDEDDDVVILGLFFNI